MKYNYEDYLFLCARINARTANLITREWCEGAISARTDEEFFARISELWGAFDDSNSDVFALPDRRLDLEFSEVMASVPDPELFSVFTYPCDCHNLKSAVKCDIKGTSAEELFIPRGSVPVKGLCELIRRRIFSSFPANMAKAAEAALESYAKNRDSQAVDILIDSACFEDMKEAVEKNPLAYFKKLLAFKSDTANILSCLRIIKTCPENAEELMKAVFVVGGSLDISVFAEALSKDAERESALASTLQVKGYGKISAKLNGALGEISEECEREYLEKALNTTGAVAGAELVAKYLTLLELEAKNLRCLIMGRRLGYTREKILSMLCEVG